MDSASSEASIRYRSIIHVIHERISRERKARGQPPFIKPAAPHHRTVALQVELKHWYQRYQVSTEPPVVASVLDRIVPREEADPPEGPDAPHLTFQYKGEIAVYTREVYEVFSDDHGITSMRTPRRLLAENPVDYSIGSFIVKSHLGIEIPFEISSIQRSRAGISKALSGHPVSADVLYFRSSAALKMVILKDADEHVVISTCAEPFSAKNNTITIPQENPIVDVLGFILRTLSQTDPTQTWAVKVDIAPYACDGRAITVGICGGTRVSNLHPALVPQGEHSAAPVVDDRSLQT
ncbi:hypothetical protein BD311DRAFT_775602 [Dichomitus squalens]|uniref:Uncharacterized protein n=1 Tax=Dichomitus squalens TaxID=114155 RepID=A0A4Q9MZL7_9APHY|nr:hypothetical protein BD311DRAFT_775602 [Dichomitus squalens]